VDHSLFSRLRSLSFALILLLLPVLIACGHNAPKKVDANTPMTIVPNTVGDFTRNFNPYSPTIFVAPGVIYETLLYFNRQDGSIKPWLAESYNVSSDASTFTFKLRNGVKWSDGQPFTSDDVVFTLNELKQYPSIDTFSMWSKISSVASPDPSTVVVKLTGPFSPLLWYLAGQTWMLPKHQWSSIGDAGQYTDPDPIGTGPYTLKSFSPQMITLTKNDNYWQPGKPVVRELRYPAFDSNVSAELVLNQSNIDWAGQYTPNIEQTFIKRDPVHNHYWFPASDVMMLYLNLAKPPFDQLAVRQAISYAVDRAQLNKIGESGYDSVAHPTALLLPRDQSFLASDYASFQFQRDTNKAAQTLESAGYKKGSDGIYAKGGQKLSFKLNLPSPYTDWVTGCQLLAGEMKEVGIDANVNLMSVDAYTNSLVTGDYDMSMGGTNSGTSPYYLYDTLLRSDNTAPIGSSATSNYERWIDPQTDSLLNTFAGTTDPTVQKQAMAGIEKIMVEQLPSIPLLYEPYWYEYVDSRFTGWPTEKNQYANPSPYTYPDNEVVLLNLTLAS
jgi:peptide/nickel transport system substrate-binding protein